MSSIPAALGSTWRCAMCVVCAMLSGISRRTQAQTVPTPKACPSTRRPAAARGFHAFGVRFVCSSRSQAIPESMATPGLCRIIPARIATEMPRSRSTSARAASDVVFRDDEHAARSESALRRYDLRAQGHCSEPVRRFDCGDVKHDLPAKFERQHVGRPRNRNFAAGELRHARPAARTSRLRAPPTSSPACRGRFAERAGRHLVVLLPRSAERVDASAKRSSSVSRSRSEQARSTMSDTPSGPDLDAAAAPAAT